MESAILSLISILIVAFIWLLPFIMIISSGKTTAGEKFAWILAVLFISWFAWIFYLLLAPLKKKDWNNEYPAIEFKWIETGFQLQVQFIIKSGELKQIKAQEYDASEIVKKIGSWLELSLDQVGTKSAPMSALSWN